MGARVDAVESKANIQKYRPEGPVGKIRKARIAKIVAENKGLMNVRADFGSKVYSQAKRVFLNGQEAETYKTLFKMGDYMQRPIQWRQIENLIIQLGGNINYRSGNGSSRTLIMPVIHDQKEDFAFATIHEPHAIFGSTFGHQGLDLLKKYFRNWGLGPEDGMIEFE